ncbi:MAG: ABC transporter ATP-binding protein [Elusimicrobiota bacterium]|jgi:lipoprotein-releasing system ATP-binding protein
MDKIPLPQESLIPAIEARGLRKSYPQANFPLEVLRGVDLAVRPGEMVALLGPSGSGKSTLLNLLGLMDAPSAGEVLLRGRPTVGADAEARARLRLSGAGFVFQFDSLLPEFTVLENVTMPARIAGDAAAAAEVRARRLLALLDILPLAERLPATLSGGERQRAAIARALLRGAAVLLADEPTGNLDRRNGETVFAKVRELADTLGVAVVLATHNREDVSRYATRVVELRDGRLEAP